ncbi:hypothetical protein HDE_06743 [Halotydeus destructor]|nr:hypothetical protein HDE_06743 [Halotydeus destructor]
MIYLFLQNLDSIFIDNIFISDNVLKYFWLCCLFIAAAQDCQYLLNEVNIDDPLKPESHEFVEIINSCQSSRARSGNLQFHKIIVIKGSEKSGRYGPTIEFVANLHNQKFDANGYLVLGGTDVEQATMKLGDNSTKGFITYTHMFTSGSRQLSNMFTNADKYPDGMLLLHHATKLKDIRLTPQHPILVSLIFYAREHAAVSKAQKKR